MRHIRFYLPQALAAHSSFALSDDAAHHAVAVLRLKEGAPLFVFNGEGGEYPATIVAASKKLVMVQTGAFNPESNESPLHTHLAIGISKGERFDLVLQKATELGVSEITPLFSERTEVKWKADREDRIRERWQKIIINACEQCYRNRIPRLHEPLSLEELLQRESSERKLILHPGAVAREDEGARPRSVCLLVGPEGGFSDVEVDSARQRGFAPLSLGPRILRTETAPLAALSILQAHWGDFSWSSQC